MKIPKLLMKTAMAGLVCIGGSSIFAAPEVVTPLTFEMMSKVTRKEDARSGFQKELKKLQGPSGGEEDAPAVFPEKLTVEGTLHLKTPDSKDEEAEQFLFTIDDAKIIPTHH